MEYYHLINRGVDGRNIVEDDMDRARFIRDLFVLDDELYSPHNDGVERKRNNKRHKRELLVCIHAFCIMPNHYHLLVTEKAKDGIARFMHKLNMGYTHYFNKKYKRKGTLWQGTYKRVLIEKDGHFLHIPFYIHLNPLDLKMRQWREGRVKDTKIALAYLEQYRWSSYLDYIGTKNFPSVTDRRDIQKLIGDKLAQQKEMRYIMTKDRLAARSLRIE